MNLCIIQNVTLGKHLALSTYLRSIVEHLADFEDVEIQLMVQKEPENRIKERENVAVHPVNGNTYSLAGNVKFMLGAMKEIHKINRGKKIDVIHSLYPNSSILSVLASKSTKRLPRDTSVLYDIRSPWINMGVERRDISKNLRKIAYFFEGESLKRVDGVVFITEELERFYRKYTCFHKPSKVIPSGVDPELFYPQYKKGELIRKKMGFSNSVVIGYLGGLHQIRELGFLVEAFRVVRDNSTVDFRLVFVGDGPSRKNLERLTEKFDLQKKIYFTGHVPHEKAAEWISSFDIGVSHLPDKLIFEYSFPLKVLEYMACGKPVLASNIRAHKNIVTNGKTGILYSPNSVDSFVDGLLLARSLLSSNTAQRCRDYSKKYSWQNISKSLHNFYRELL